MNIEINYLAVLLAGVAAMGLGFFWYGPWFLGPMWMKERKFTADSLKKARKEMGKLYGLSFVASLVTACVLNHAMVLYAVFYQYPMLSAGLMTAFWMWLGFVLPTQLTATIFGNKNWKLLAIDTGYQFAALMAMALVIAWL